MVTEFFARLASGESEEESARATRFPRTPEAPELLPARHRGSVAWALFILLLVIISARAGDRSSSSEKAIPPAFAKPAPTSIADLKSIEEHVKKLVKKVSPAVVAVEIGNGSGSGVVISTNGLVLTAGHVIDTPRGEVRFTFPDGKTARGKTLGIAEEADAGLLRITDPGPWPHVELSDLKQDHTGDWVLALGHPGGFELKRSLVVRLGRIIRLEADGLQTDCTISPGDSGGPLFDMHGKVIGVHSFISTSAADNYHVPVSSFSDQLDRLVKAEKKR